MPLRMLLALTVMAGILLGCPVVTTNPVDSPSLGMGLNGIADWSTQLPFLDHFKTARYWVAHAPNTWDTGETDFDLDENGWPRTLPTGNAPQRYRSLGTLLFRGIAGKYPTGRYVVLYEGEGSIGYEFAARKVAAESVPGRDVLDVSDSSDGVHIVISATDPKRTGNYIRNIRVVREDQLPLYEAGLIFNPEWLARVRDFRAIRFMDWMMTNGSPQQTWDDRPRPAMASYAWAGVPVEVMVQLANDINADPWFCLPHQADDDYFRQFATLVRAQLDPRLTAFYEFSNEVWNWGFDQAHYAHARGQERWGTSVTDAWVQWYGMRAAQMADIVGEVYGREIPARAKRVLATQTGYYGLANPILNAPKWVAEGNAPPYTRFECWGVTGYFGGQLATARSYATLKTWIAANREQALLNCLQELRGGSVLQTGDSVLDTIDDFAHHRQVAAQHGLEMVAYEAGTHVVGLSGNNPQGQFVDVRNDLDLALFLIELNRRPEMQAIYQTLMDGWRVNGGTLFNHFVDVGQSTRYGSWGALDHLDDQTPRWNALTAFNTSVAGWWENRPSGTFVNGMLHFGTAQAERVDGTQEEDYLSGALGNDVLFGNAGNDGLHGGAGTDTALYLGQRAQYTFRVEGRGVRVTGPEGRDLLVDIELVQFGNAPPVALETLLP